MSKAIILNRITVNVDTLVAGLGGEIRSRQVAALKEAIADEFALFESVIKDRFDRFNTQLETLERRTRDLEVSARDWTGKTARFP